MEEAGGCTGVSQGRLVPAPKPGLGFGAHSAFHAVSSPPTEIPGKASLTWAEEEGNLSWIFLAAIAATSVLVSERDAAPCKLKELQRSGPKR